MTEEQNRKALESLGIDFDNFGQHPWDESDLEPTKGRSACIIDLVNSIIEWKDHDD